MIVAVIFFWVGFSQAATSVELGGWKFTTNLDGWRVDSESEGILAYDSSDSYNWAHSCYGTDWNEVKGSWKGVVLLDHIIYPSYPNAPKDNDNYAQS